MKFISKVQFFLLLIINIQIFGMDQSNKERTDSIETMRQAIESLDKNNPFEFVNLDIPKETLLLINKKLIINFEGHCDIYGNLAEIKIKLPEFLKNIGNEDEELIETITYIIFNITQQVTQASNKEAAWLSVRAFTPVGKYDIPRWHMDGYFYRPFSGFAFKFATVLKGPSTLFYKVHENLREEFFVNQQDREFLSKLLDINQSISPHEGQGVFFIVGDRNNAAIHSEPKISETRLFFSVLPGTNEEIDELYSRWHHCILS